MSRADSAVARDDKRRWKRKLSKSRLEVVFPAEAEQDGIVHFDLRGVPFHVREVVSINHGNADHNQSSRLVSVVQLHEPGNFLPARRTPRGPEIQQNYLALVIGEAD